MRFNRHEPLDSSYKEPDIMGGVNKAATWVQDKTGISALNRTAAAVIPYTQTNKDLVNYMRSASDATKGVGRGMLTPESASGTTGYKGTPAPIPSNYTPTPAAPQAPASSRTALGGAAPTRFDVPTNDSGISEVDSRSGWGTGTGGTGGYTPEEPETDTDKYWKGMGVDMSGGPATMDKENARYSAVGRAVDSGRTFTNSDLDSLYRNDNSAKPMVSDPETLAAIKARGDADSARNRALIDENYNTEVGRAQESAAYNNARAMMDKLTGGQDIANLKPKHQELLRETLPNVIGMFERTGQAGDAKQKTAIEQQRVQGYLHDIMSNDPVKQSEAAKNLSAIGVNNSMADYHKAQASRENALTKTIAPGYGTLAKADQWKTLHSKEAPAHISAAMKGIENIYKALESPMVQNNEGRYRELMNNLAQYHKVLGIGQEGAVDNKTKDLSSLDK